MNIKHRETKTRLYNIWVGIKGRCTNQKDTGWGYYGGRGISVYEEWKTHYEIFRDWSILNGYENSLTIDRIDNNGNYEPSNCRWVDRTIQSRNTKRIYSNNTSGYRGVSWHKGDRRWMSQIKVNGKGKYIGSFKCKVWAALAYDMFVIGNDLEHTRNFA